jgi:hypothetical protein
LKIGDEVVLMKQKGGQKYLVIDRVVKAWFLQQILSF